MSTSRQLLFLADSHLRGPTDENQTALVDFLRQHASRHTGLVILGDLFDFMAGYNQVAIDNYRSVLDGLTEFSPLYFYEGNHDFDLSKRIPGLELASIRPGPAPLTYDGCSFQLMHGDRTSRSDLGTRLLRRALQGRVLRFARDRLLSDEFVFKFALAFANVSRWKTWPGRTNEADSARVRALAEGRANRVAASIFAHTHRPLLEQEADLTIANPGPAVVGGSYLLYEDRRLSLHRFPDGELLPPGRLSLKPPCR